MAERVETGGLINFSYDNDSGSKLSNRKKKEIEKAYGKYHERRKREKRNKIIKWSAAILLLISLLVWFLF